MNEETLPLVGDHVWEPRTASPDKSRGNPELHPIFPSYRLLVCMIAFLGNSCSFGSQSLVGASLLLMIRHDDDAIVNVTAASTSTQPSKYVHGIPLNNENEWYYDWDKTAKGWLVSSYFVGYYVMQIPTGWLLGQYGGCRLILCSGAVTVVCQALCVWIPRYGPCPFAALLFVNGMANACASPSIFAVTAKWTHPRESSRLMSLVLSGNSFGNVLVYCVSAGTSTVNLLGGWPFNFIVMVVMQLLFLFLWRMFVTDAPEENTFIKASEARYVTESVSQPALDSAKKLKTTPWSKILTSAPVYGVAASLFGADWLVYGIITVYPAYFTEVSILSGLPWLLCPFTAYMVSHGVDTLRERQCLSTTTLRKVADIIAKPAAGSFLLLSAFLPEGHVTFSAVLYVMAVLAVISFQGSSWAANFAELSPDHTGVVIMIAQLFSLTGPFLEPPLVATLTSQNSAVEWQMCFGITLGICVVTSFIYVILGSSQRQDWEEGPKGGVSSRSRKGKF